MRPNRLRDAIRANGAGRHVLAAGRVLLNHNGQRRATLRTYQYSLLRRLTSEAVVNTHDGLFYIATDDAVIGRSLYISGGFDREQQTAVLKLIPPLEGKMVLDIGANIGTSTVRFLNAGAGHVVAVEPDPRNARLLRQNLAINGLTDRSTVVEAACGSHPGRGWMRLNATNLGDHRLADSGDVPVTVTTLDAVVASTCQRPEDVALVWVDIQGHESEALALSSFLRQHLPALAVEITPSVAAESQHYAALLELLAAYEVGHVIHGLEVALLDERGPASILDSLPPGGHADLLLN